MYLSRKSSGNGWEMLRVPQPALTALPLGHGAGRSAAHPAIFPALRPACPLPWRQGTSTHHRETPQGCSPGSSGLDVETEQICISFISYLEGNENIQLSQTAMLFVSGVFLVINFLCTWHPSTEQWCHHAAYATEM